MSEKIRVVLAEDHHLVRVAVGELLAKEEDIEVVGLVADGHRLVEFIAQMQPDVLVLDAKMPGHNVVESTRLLTKKYPHVRILVLSAYKRREYVIGLLREGASGYVVKDDAPEVLAKAIREVAQGREWISHQVAHILLKSMRQDGESRLSQLTPREMDVLILMARGMRNSDIAEKLILTKQTVKNYTRKVYNKLGVDTRVEAVLYAIKHGLVSEDEIDV